MYILYEIFLFNNLSIFNFSNNCLSNFLKNIMEINVFTACSDNFMYLLVDRQTNECAAIDPVEPGKIFDFVNKNKLKIKYVLTTHHHWDHSGGNKKLLDLLSYNISVVGGDDRVESLNLKVKNGQIINLGDIEIECLHTPCHTTGHICYFVKNKTDANQEPVVFTGDTLFIAGCGRFFEGTASQMHHSLIEILRKLPPLTKVYCGHEYTVKNLKFALTIEPNNENIHKKLKWAQDQVTKGLNTVPSTISDEILTNPFMRVDVSTVNEACNSTDPIQVMHILRKLKDDF